MASRADPRRTFREECVADLGLVNNLDYPLRVYVLACAVGYYVGISPSEKLVERVDKQFNGDGATFCKYNRPTRVVCVWPAACPAIEAAMYFAMMGKMCLNAWANMYMPPICDECE